MKILELLGETTEYDKKQAVERRKIKSWLKSVSAFANGVGGKLIFGIADNDEVIGLEDAKSDAEFISQNIKEYLDPTPKTILSIKTNDDRNFIILDVFGGEDTPYYYRGDSVMQSYIRIGNESVIADSIELKRLVLRGKHYSYDALISAFHYSDYSFTKLRERFKKWTGKSFDEKMFCSFGILDEQGLLTNAGALLADESPVYHSRIFCVRWNGLTKAGGVIDALDSGEYNGSLISLLSDGESFIRRNTKMMWMKTANSRIEMPEYVERSYSEALVNALVHRDYLIIGSEVHIDIFDDRMEIYSPGGMPDGRIIQNINIKELPSTRRNPVLADIFNRLGFMERQGSGLDKIVRGYEFEEKFSENKRPQFFSDRVQFKVVLPNLNYEAARHGEKSGGKNGGKNEAIARNEEQRILKFLTNFPFETQEKIAVALDISVRTVERKIRNLKNQNLIERVGSRTKGYWRILHK